VENTRNNLVINFFFQIGTQKLRRKYSRETKSSRTSNAMLFCEMRLN